jgi:hypothetical protein
MILKNGEIIICYNKATIKAVKLKALRVLTLNVEFFYGQVIKGTIFSDFSR